MLFYVSMLYRWCGLVSLTQCAEKEDEKEREHVRPSIVVLADTLRSA